MRSSNFLLSIPLIFLLSACEEQQKTPAYVSPLEFKKYSCKQITKEMTYVSAKLDKSADSSQLDSVMNAGIMIYGISQGMGMSSGGDDPQVEYLRARYEALHQASIEKNCD